MLSPSFLQCIQRCCPFPGPSSRPLDASFRQTPDETTSLGHRHSEGTRLPGVQAGTLAHFARQNEWPEVSWRSSGPNQGCRQQPFLQVTLLRLWPVSPTPANAVLPSPASFRCALLFNICTNVTSPIIHPDTCLEGGCRQGPIPQMSGVQRLGNLLKVPSIQVSGFLETGSGCG